MRVRWSVFIAVSLDGFIARADGGIDWLARVEQPSEDYGYARFHESIDNDRGRAAHVRNRARVPRVALRRQALRGVDAWGAAGRARRGFWRGEPQAIVSRLEAVGSQPCIDGGRVIEQFLSAGLIDDLTLSVIPLLLGEGDPPVRPHPAATSRCSWS
jgi:dihydrofolate reductase